MKLAANPASPSISTANHEYWTYIFVSLSRRLYIGMTDNIERCMREHKSGEFEGFASKITAIAWCT